MIGVDTNVLVRWLVSDQAHEHQSLAAKDALRDQTIFVSIITLVETVWLLRGAYKRASTEVQAVVANMIASPRFKLESDTIVEAALHDTTSLGGDLADHLIARTGAASGCKTTLTFDRKAARSPHFTLLPS